MGAWGTGISSNDGFADVYGEFFELYNDGGEPADISRKLINDYWEMIEEPDDSNNFWFALALAQWECKQLAPDELQKVTTIIESGNDIEVWRGLGATEKDLRKRSEVLKNFLKKLRSEKPKARARKKVKIIDPSFEKGVCVIYRLSNGNYGGAVMLEAISGKGYAYNLVAVTRINQKERPVITDFEKTDVLLTKFGGKENNETIYWMSPDHFTKDKELFEPIGKVEINREFDKQSSQFGFCGAWKIWIIDTAESQFELEESVGIPSKRLTVASFLKKPWWKLW